MYLRCRTTSKIETNKYILNGYFITAPSHCSCKEQRRCPLKTVKYLYLLNERGPCSISVGRLNCHSAIFNWHTFGNLHANELLLDRITRGVAKLGKDPFTPNPNEVADQFMKHGNFNSSCDERIDLCWPSDTMEEFNNANIITVHADDAKCAAHPRAIKRCCASRVTSVTEYEKAHIHMLGWLSSANRSRTQEIQVLWISCSTHAHIF